MCVLKRFACRRKKLPSLLLFCHHVALICLNKAKRPMGFWCFVIVRRVKPGFLLVVVSLVRLVSLEAGSMGLF